MPTQLNDANRLFGQLLSDAALHQSLSVVFENFATVASDRLNDKNFVLVPGLTLSRLHVGFGAPLLADFAGRKVQFSFFDRIDPQSGNLKGFIEVKLLNPAFPHEKHVVLQTISFDPNGASDQVIDAGTNTPANLVVASHALAIVLHYVRDALSKLVIQTANTLPSS